MRLFITPAIRFDIIPITWDYAPAQGCTKGIGFRWLFFSVNIEHNFKNKPLEEDESKVDADGDN